MVGRVAHMECRYRVIRPPGLGEPPTVRPESLPIREVAEAIERSLRQVLGDDPTVYVMRKVDAHLTFSSRGTQTVDLGRLLGKRVAGAAMRAIADNPGNSDNVVRFENQADYVAQFVADLLVGRAWNRWFYGVFAFLRTLEVCKALEVVLLDHRTLFSQVLAGLQRRGAVESLLRKLEGPALNRLWSTLTGSLPGDPESFRPIYSLAMCLLDRLRLWKRPPVSSEALFESFVATGPPPVDWNDERDLTVAVMRVVRFLFDKGLLDSSPTLDDGFADLLRRALAGYDWVDKVWLTQSITDLLSTETAKSTGTDGDKGFRSRLPGAGPTPRQKRLLADILEALKTGGLRLDKSRPGSSANAMALYAALAASAPSWETDSMAPVMIERMLAAWAQAAASPRIRETLRCLRHNDFSGALETFAEARRPLAAANLAIVRDLGAPALDLLEELAGLDKRGGLRQEGVLADTSCAGLFLLLRAVMDARLHWLSETMGYPPGEMPSTKPGALLTALGLRWAGSAAERTGELDPGLALWAGLDKPVSAEAFAGAWRKIKPQTHAGFQAGLLSTLAGLLLARNGVAHFFHLTLDDGCQAIVVGDETGKLWPLGHVLEQGTDLTGVVRQCLTDWEEALGRRPEEVLCDESLACALAALSREGVQTVSVHNDMSPGSAEDRAPTPVEAHRAGRRDLLAALESLGHGRMGAPAADLTVALTCISLLRLWARWLRKFEASGIPYLLDNFIRWPGRIWVNSQVILVDMAHMPLDLVIEMAGYTAELTGVPWLGGRRVQFSSERS